MERLADAIDDLLGIDPASMSDSERHDLVVALAEQASRLAAARARVLALWEASRDWAQDGSRSAAGRLARDCRSSLTTARRELRRARKLQHMPLVAAAFAAGRLSVDSVDLFVNVAAPQLASLFARDEHVVVTELPQLRYEQAARLVTYWKHRAETEAGVDSRDPDVTGRQFHADRSFRGSVNLSGRLPALAGTGFLDELRRLETELFEEDLGQARPEWGDNALAHLARTPAQRRADALLVMAARSTALRTTGGTGLPVPLFTVLVDYQTARDALHRRVCETEDGTVVHPHDLLDRMTDADFERIVFDGHSRVIDVGRRTRTFRGALRRAIQVRDRHCQHPSGCDQRDCQIDHDEEYEDGGETSQDNGQLHCSYHNRWKHQHKTKPPPPNNPDEPPTAATKPRDCLTKQQAT